MADTSREKILKINTQGAEKNVKTLKQQIKELKEQLAQLDKGTEEYNRVSKQLADTNQKQIEINEAMKYSNKDLGATLSNLTKVSAGVVGAISSVNSVMTLMGADSEEAQKAMMRIQSLMAIIQGMSAIDTAIKALKGLTVAFKDFNTVKGTNAAVTAGAATAEFAEAGALADNTVKMHKNNEEAKEYNRLNEEGAEATKKSTDEINKETTSILARTEAQRGNIEVAKKYYEELEKLNEAQASDVSNAKNLGFSKALDEYEKRIKNAQAMLEYHSQGMTNEMKAMYEQQIKDYSSAITRMMHTSVTTTDDIMVAVEGSLQNLIMASKGSFEDMEEEAIVFNELIKGLPFDEATKKAEEANDLFERCLTSFREGAMAGEEGMEDAIRDFTDLQHIFNAETEATLATLKEREIQQAQLKKQIVETIEAEDTETAATEANTVAKRKNADATGDVADAEKKLGTETKKNDPILRKAWSGLINGIKNAAKALWAFIKTNPILFSMIAIVAGIGYGISKWANAYADARKEAAELQKMQNEIKMEFKKQEVDMEALLRMFKNQNTTQEQKEVLAKKINKLANDELVIRNKITGEWELSNEKVEEYMANLKTSIALEYHKKQILESMDAEEEARNGAIYEKNHLIGKLFKTVSKYEKEATEEVAKQAKHWREIEKLTAGTVKNIKNEIKEVKTTTGGGGIKKTFKELFNELFELYKKLYKQIASASETRKIFNGIYSEAIIAFDKIADIVNTNRFAHKLSDGFMKAFSNGLKGVKSTDITLDFIFGDNFTKLEEQLNQAKDKLKGMLKQTKISEKELLKQKTVVENLEKQLQVYNDIANAVLKYRQTVESTRQAELDRINAVAQYNKELDINMRYMEKQRRESRREFQYGELEKEIELNKTLAAVTNARLEEERQRIEKLRNSNLQNRETIEEIAELQKKIDEDQRTVNEARLNISNASWQIRLTKLDEEYAKIKRNVKEEQQALEIERTQTGGGVADFNTEVDLIEMELRAMEEYADYIDEFYEKRKAKYDKNSDEWLLLEQERLSAQEALQDEYREREIEKEQAQADRKLNIQKAYINTYQTISSEISNVLGEVMNMYDENSKEYLNLKYAQGVTDTISGSLAAFMSGVESGLPAPLNFILGGVLSASTLAVGIMQLANLKKGNLQNTSASTVDIGTEYDTLSYAQNSEIVGAIQDQRCYVVESDITSTQNRVQVAETQATF